MLTFCQIWNPFSCLWWLFQSQNPFHRQPWTLISMSQESHLQCLYLLWTNNISCKIVTDAYLEINESIKLENSYVGYVKRKKISYDCQLTPIWKVKNFFEKLPSSEPFSLDLADGVAFFCDSDICKQIDAMLLAST